VPRHQYAGTSGVGRRQDRLCTGMGAHQEELVAPGPRHGAGLHRMHDRDHSAGCKGSARADDLIAEAILRAENAVVRRWTMVLL
jgi:hypothetical protein